MHTIRVRTAALSMAMLAMAMLAIAILSAPVSASDALPQGLKVGDTIPRPFAATDRNGAARDFRSLADKKGLILLFTRSLDW